MKIYIIMGHESYEDRYILNIYSDKEGAEKALIKFKEELGDENYKLSIEEHCVVKSSKLKSESYMTNCIIVPRKDDILFHVKENSDVLASLDGYAVIPIEQYKSSMSGYVADLELINHLKGE